MKTPHIIKRNLNKTSALWVILSATLIALSHYHVIPSAMVEVIGFLSGALCVYLLVRQNIWNWPVGIINAVMYIVLFYQARLFADMALQVVYVALGFLGWYWWLRGGENKTALKVHTTSKMHALILLSVGAIATFGMHTYLVTINDSAPFWDALTTVMSLIAQYMLTRKLIENWAVWIAADMIYIALYASRGLYLTSVLYAVFLSLCIAGAIEWYKSRTATPLAAVEEI
jgi:nicotinamide mononucleotide transporter